MVNGDDGMVENTFAAGNKYEGSHLDADKALNCPIAMAYFVVAFAALNEVEREEWLNTWSPAHRFELGSLLLSWGAGGDTAFYMAVDIAGMDVEDAGAVLKALNDSLEGSPFTDAEFRDTYTMQLSKPLAELQREAREETSEDRFIDQMLSMLRNDPSFSA